MDFGVAPTSGYPLDSREGQRPPPGGPPSRPAIGSAFMLTAWIETQGIRGRAARRLGTHSLALVEATVRWIKPKPVARARRTQTIAHDAE